MPAEHTDAPLRASTLIGRTVRDHNGQMIGRVADIETSPDEHGRQRLVALVVTAGRWGRLLGYERHETTGPWLLEHLARIVLRRHTTRVPWTDAHLSQDGRSIQ